MKRRGFISSIATVAALRPLTGAAQEPERVRRIGILMGYAESDPDTQANLAALREALDRLGWAEGHNIRIETRWAIPADLGSMRRSAKDLVALRPDLILSEVTPTTAALLRSSRWRPAMRFRQYTSFVSSRKLVVSSAMGPA